MRAVVFENGRVRVVRRPRPRPVETEARIKVLWAGICATDLELLSGYHDFSGIPGHEFVGEVVQAAGRPDLTGRRVVAEINAGCGQCPDCRAGDARQCLQRKALGIRGWDGAFAEEIAAPLANLHLVPPEVTDEEAVFTEPLAAALRIAEQIHLTPGLKAAVLGDGKLGLLTALTLKVFLPDLVLWGRRPERLALARDQGVAVGLVPAGISPAGLAEMAGTFDLVIEATGRVDGLDFALALVRPRGTVAAKTTLRSPSRIDLADLVVREIRLTGSRCGRFEPALGFLKEKRIRVSPLIEARYPLADFPRALEHARRPGAGKVLIRVGGGD
jgi:threonine dehydrogenase-like Zn-dependent dehydrogenase